ncbi:MAG: Uma2 family endonuclease [Segetibacter sp.]
MRLAEKFLPHYTYDDWLNWEGRWELIEGHPIAMSPMPVPEHQRVAGELITELTLALRKSKCKSCKAYQPLDYKISDDTIFEPDILIVCGKINRNYLDFPPALIVEILSKSTEERDRGIKYDYYEREGVKYYLIVDAKKRSIEIYELVNDHYQLQEYKNAFEFTLEDNCIITPELQNVWENV